MFSKEKDYISVCLGNETLKVVHLKTSSGERKIVNVVQRDLKDISEEELPRSIQASLDSINVKNPYGVCLIPANMATTKNIEIPSLDAAEIKSIIDLQASRHTPYSREEILLGYINIGIFQRNYTKILLIIVNRQIIIKQLDILKRAGVRIERVLFAPEVIARLYAEVLKLKQEDAPIGIIDVGSHFTDFIVEHKQTVVTCRNLPIGFSHLVKEGDSAREKLIVELAKSIEVYQHEDIEKLPETYFLTSDDVKIKELQPSLTEKLKANIKIVPYLDNVKSTQSAMLKLVSEYNNASFLDAVSSLMVGERAQVDLMPDEIKTQKAIEEQGRQMIKAGAMSIVLLLLVCIIFFTKIYFRSTFLTNITNKYININEEVKALERISEKSRIVKNYLNQRLISLEVIEELYRNIPNEIYLKSLDMNQEGQISIVGTSESMSRVFNLVSSLEESILFKSVKTKSTTAKKERGKDVAAFEIVFKLESAKDDEGTETEAETGTQAPTKEPSEGKEKK